MSDEICDRCYQPLLEGEHGVYLCPLERRRDVLPSKGYEPHFDIGLGETVTGWGDVRQHMRRNKLDFRDHPSPGEMSARRDKNEQRKRDEQRQRAERAETDDNVIAHPSSVTCDGLPTVLFDAQNRPLRRQIGYRP